MNEKNDQTTGITPDKSARALGNKADVTIKTTTTNTLDSELQKQAHVFSKLLRWFLAPIEALMERVLDFIHSRISIRHRFIISIISLSIYSILVISLVGFLGVAVNYFVLIPLLTIASLSGLLVGMVAGILSLPFNLFLLWISGGIRFAPENLLIAEISGMSVGMVVGFLGDYYRKLQAEIQNRLVAEQQLQSSLEEKEILLQEVHHRVKNNLAVISSLINLQAGNLEDPFMRETLQQVRQRVHSIYLVHEKLYRSHNLNAVDFTSYAEGVVEHIKSSMTHTSSYLKYTIEGHNISLVIDQLIPIGIILNELVTNSLKYAFDKIKNPRLKIEIQSIGKSYTFSVKDNGIGFKEGFDPLKSGNLGFRLVKGLIQQLSGQHEIISSPEQGVEFLLTFPKGG
jgi:two-component sensor histidine kinase